MNPFADHQPERRMRGAGVDGSQKSILGPDQGNGTAGGNRFAPLGIGALAPDDHAILRAGQAQMQRMPRQFQNAPDAPLPQKTEVVMKKPPGNPPGGGVLAHWPTSVIVFAALAVPVMA